STASRRCGSRRNRTAGRRLDHARPPPSTPGRPAGSRRTPLQDSGWARRTVHGLPARPAAAGAAAPREPGPLMNDLFPLLFAAALGAIIGSFLNVCIYRLPLGKSLVWPASGCPSCGQPIAWFDNVPLVGYAVLRGRCRACRAPISLRYPIV